MSGAIQLLQVAGLGWSDKARPGRTDMPYSKHNLDVAQQMLSRKLVAGKRVSTHLGRVTFATFWELRVLAVRYPFLLETPLYRKLSLHFWFSPEGIEKMTRLLGGSRHPHVDLARSIMGLASSHQFHFTYTRRKPLQFQAWPDTFRFL